jgi:hypothetical protein
MGSFADDYRAILVLVYEPTASGKFGSAVGDGTGEEEDLEAAGVEWDERVGTAIIGGGGVSGGGVGKTIGAVGATLG